MMENMKFANKVDETQVDETQRAQVPQKGNTKSNHSSNTLAFRKVQSFLLMFRNRTTPSYIILHASRNRAFYRLRIRALLSAKAHFCMDDCTFLKLHFFCTFYILEAK